MEIYQESTKVSDIFGANKVPIPTRTVRLSGVRTAYLIGSLVVAPAGSDVFTLMNTANRDSPQCGVLGEFARRPQGAPANSDFTGTIYTGGSFQAEMLLVEDETPNPSVNVRERREYLLARNIYLETGDPTASNLSP
jgi:hypothetical protein